AGSVQIDANEEVRPPLRGVSPLPIVQIDDASVAALGARQDRVRRDTDDFERLVQGIRPDLNALTDDWAWPKHLRGDGCTDNHGAPCVGRSASGCERRPLDERDAER